MSLSTCAICGATITNERGAWQHVKPGSAHRAEPDDSAVSGPYQCACPDCEIADEDDHCEWCDEIHECTPECACPQCEGVRALDEDADAYYGRND